MIAMNMNAEWFTCWITWYPEVERQQLGSVHRLADVLIRLVEDQRLVSEQAVSGDQLGGLVLLPVQTTVEFGEEEVDLVRRLLFDGVELKDLQTENSS